MSTSRRLTCGWKITKIDAQIAWNLFLTAPETGGDCTNWNAPLTVPIVPGEPPPKSYGLGDECASTAPAEAAADGRWAPSLAPPENELVVWS